MKVIDILEFIDSFAPFNTALPFDNAGLLVGDGQREINKIGAVLDGHRPSGGICRPKRY